MKILAVSGSLREKSFNTMALQEIKKYLSQDVEMEVYSLKNIPLYNEELENNLPQSVIDFKSAIKNSDAILFACPEYNHSISGVLKNAIDWGTRPEIENSFSGKPGAMLGASNGRIGTARAQIHLREICATVGIILMHQPAILLAEAQNLFDENGNLKDEKTKVRMQKFTSAFIDWINTWQRK
jgi:chromate reductase